MQDINSKDIPYEEDCLRNPFQVKSWVRYYEFKQTDNEKKDQIFILSRAVKALPRSYKLWKILLDLLVKELLITKESDFRFSINPEFPPYHQQWLIVNGYFEKALILCHKFPRIWCMYLQFLMHQSGRTTYCRRTFDRALRALPVTQHKDIWDLYLDFATNAGGETAVRIWRRFVRMQPSHAERYVGVLTSLNPPRTAEAARVLSAIIEDPETYANPNSKTTYEYWSLLCKLVIEHPSGISLPSKDHLVPVPDYVQIQRPNYMDVEKILRTGISKFRDQVGLLWNSLAQWWILQGDFDQAQNVFEEGIANVRTLKDFTMIFDSYAKMEESVLNDAMSKLSQFEGKELPEDYLDELDVDFRLARFERLMERRPYLVNEVILRQNPHNVNEWRNRVQLWLESKNEDMAVKTYEEAVVKINPYRAVGKPHELWVEYATFFEQKGYLSDAEKIFERATQAKFRKVDDLAYIWCQWAEYAIRQKNYKGALEILGRGTSPTTARLDILYGDDTKTPQQRLFKCTKLWSFYADLEESIGTVETTKAVYDRILELKIASPQIIINYASFLEENNYFEESYRVYERGVNLFGYPVAFEIWNLYLVKFVERYKGTKLERARDLFEQALENCPNNLSKPFYLLYAKLEEDYGLARHALRIYERGTNSVAPADLEDMFNIYIAKAASFFGIIATREIYSKAVEVLPDKSARNFAIKFAAMEVKLGEVDRARAIYGYASQICDPRLHPNYWQSWHEFEVKFGNEDTYKEMLRIKRSVQAKYNSEVSFISSQILAARGIDVTAEEGVNNITNGSKIAGFVRAETTEPKVTVASENPEEIEINDESDDEPELEIPEAVVPNEVFGGLAQASTSEENGQQQLGARERFKRKLGS